MKPDGLLMDNPIIIISLPRSGSSMTAGLFAKHGVWTGPCQQADSRNPKGYYESSPFKKEIIAQVGAIVHKGILAPMIVGWRETAERIIRENGYIGGPWLVKHSAMYYPLWHEFDARYICVRRSIDAIRKSGKASGLLKNDKAIRPHIGAMDYVRDRLGGVDVFTDDLIRGDYSSLRRAFAVCELQMDETIVRDFIDPNLWHY